MTASLVASVAGRAIQHAHTDLDFSMLRAQHLIKDTILIDTYSSRESYPIGRPDVILTVGRGYSLQAFA